MSSHPDHDALTAGHDRRPPEGTDGAAAKSAHIEPRPERESNGVPFAGPIVRTWRFWLARFQGRLGNAAAAEANYRKILSGQPDCLDALAPLGRLLLLQRRYQEAVPVWHRAAKIAPASPTVLFQYSRALHRSGQLKSASSQYLRVLALDPRHEKAFTALEELGRRWGRTGSVTGNAADVDAAVEIGEHLLVLRPQSDRAHAFARATARAIAASGSTMIDEQPERALALFSAALRLDPTQPDALRGGAVCLERLDQPDKALELTERQLELNPAAIEPRLRKERLLFALGGDTGKKAAGASEPDLSPQEQAVLLERARRLVGEAAALRFVRELSAQERAAMLLRARGLTVEGEAPEINPQEHAVLLERARRLVGDSSALGFVGELSAHERAAMLSRAHRLAAAARAPDEVTAIDPRVYAVLLEWARLVVGEASAPQLVQVLSPQERELMVLRVGELAAGQTAEALLPTDPREREALVEHAWLLVEGAGGLRRASSIESLLEQARSAFNDGRSHEAEARWRRVLARDPSNIRALSGLSRHLMREQRWSEAVDLLTRLASLPNATTEPKHLLARALRESDQLQASAEVYTQLSVLEPDNAKVWRSIGQVNGRLGEWPAARVAWTRVVELEPDSIDARFELATACQQAGDAGAAEAILRQVLEFKPDDRRALTLLARARQAVDPEGALACWARLSELDPAAAGPHLQIARIHMRRGTLDKAGDSLDRAEGSFRRVLAREPGNIDAMTGLGRVLTAAKRTDDALAHWQQLADQRPELVEPRLQIARILQGRNDPGTEDALRQVLRVDPTNLEALRRTAQLLARHRATTEASLEIWQQLADLEPKSVQPLAQRGRLQERLGRIAEAEAEYRGALARDQNHPMALGDLARFFRVHRRWDEAAEIYHRHLLLEPQRMDVILGLGQCFDRTNRLQEAKEFYDRALAIEPGNITALGYRGRLLRTRGEVNAAIADFRRICELEPQNAEAWHELIFQLAGAEREPEALEALANAEAALGDTPQAWSILGRAAAASQFDKQAIAFFRRAIEAEPENAAHHAQLGLYYFRQGILDGALHHLLDSRERDPRNVEVARRLFDTTSALRELGYDHVSMSRGVRTAGEILVPERLFAHARMIAETQVEPYEPVPHSVIAISATLAPGGAERQLANMLRGLSDPRFNLKLALFCISLTPRLRRDFFLPVLDGTGVEVVVPDTALTSDYLHSPEVKPFANLIRHFPPDLVGPMAFWLQEFRRRRPQVVHAWQDSTNLTAVVAALLAGVPRIVLCCRSVHPDNPRRRLRRFMHDAYQVVLDHPALVMSNNSRAGADDYAEWLGIASSRVEVVYNGIDFDRLDKGANSGETAAARSQVGVPPGAPVLGGVFRMSEEKRPLLWLDVAAVVARTNKEVHFVICGDGPMRDEMRDHAESLGIGDRVHLAGAQSDIGLWYKMMDVVMLTSRHEGLPNVLLEAQSLGIPVVAPDVGGMSEVVEQGVTGWTIRDADAESLGERVLFSLFDEEWRRVAVERAPRFVRETFSIEAMLHRNLEVYEISPHVTASN